MCEPHTEGKAGAGDGVVPALGGFSVYLGREEQSTERSQCPARVGEESDVGLQGPSAEKGDVGHARDASWRRHLPRGLGR